MTHIRAIQKIQKMCTILKMKKTTKEAYRQEDKREKKLESQENVKYKNLKTGHKERDRRSRFIFINLFSLSPGSSHEFFHYKEHCIRFL